MKVPQSPGVWDDGNNSSDVSPVCCTWQLRSLPIDTWVSGPPGAPSFTKGVWASAAGARVRAPHATSPARTNRLTSRPSQDWGSRVKAAMRQLLAGGIAAPELHGVPVTIHAAHPDDHLARTGARPDHHHLAAAATHHARTATIHGHARAPERARHAGEEPAAPHARLRRAARGWGAGQPRAEQELGRMVGVVQQEHA